MIGVKINKAKSLFFNKDLLKALGRGEFKALSKMGAYIRTSARSSIRKRKKSSKPRTPPSSHTGLLKKHIYFGYDKIKNTLIVGPARLTGTESQRVPEILEFGGNVEIQRKKGSFFAEIAPRPYMGPALKKNQPRFPALYANVVKPD